MRNHAFIPELPFNVEHGKSLAETGMQMAIESAQQKSKDWKEDAMDLLREFIQTKKEFMCEEFREYAHAHGLLVPPSKRAFGGIIAKAAFLGWIKNVGYRKVKNPIAHRANAAVWIKAESAVV